SPTPAPPTTTPTSSSSPTPPDPWAAVDPGGQAIVFWHSQQYEREQVLLEIIAEFNTSNPWGIEVTTAAHTGQNDLFYAAREALNTTAAPDLVYLFQNQAATLQRFDGLVDLTGLLLSPDWGISSTELAEIPPALLAQDIYPALDGIRLGFPTYRSAEVLYINLDWLHELGYANPPQTPQEFKAIACKASQQPFTRRIGSAASLGYALTIDASRFAAWTFAFGGDLYNSDNNAYTFNSPPAVQAMLFLQDLIASGCAEVIEQRYADQDGFARGSILFTLGTSAGIPFYSRAVDEYARFQWNISAPPHLQAEPHVNIYGPSLSILRSTPEKELAAWLLLKHLSTPAVQARWTAVSQYLPVNSAADGLLTTPFADYPALQSADQLISYAQFEPNLPGYEDVRVLVAEALLDIARGAGVVSTLNSLNAQANTILADQGK
ncbi:MAG TPA: extracellular solute-binding protein, partial [Anaerolineales bacterium]|nr:extracellular solute-binding protein [Anaerolineales bacterium]